MAAGQTARRGEMSHEGGREGGHTKLSSQNDLFHLATHVHQTTGTTSGAGQLVSSFRSPSPHILTPCWYDTLVIDTSNSSSETTKWHYTHKPPLCRPPQYHSLHILNLLIQSMSVQPVTDIKTLPTQIRTGLSSVNRRIVRIRTHEDLPVPGL